MLRSILGQGSRLVTSDLDDALTALVTSLDRSRSPDTASAIRAARSELASTAGRLTSRPTRTPNAG